MHCEEKSNTNSVGCVLCGSCGESVTYLFPLKMISPFPSPSLFSDVSEGWRCRGKEIKTFFFLPSLWRYGRCAERAEFSLNAVAVALFMALCAPIICVCTLHCSKLPPRTYPICVCVCVCVYVHKEADQDKCMCLLCEQMCCCRCAHVFVFFNNQFVCLLICGP